MDQCFILNAFTINQPKVIAFIIPIGVAYSCFLEKSYHIAVPRKSVLLWRTNYYSKLATIQWKI